MWKGKKIATRERGGAEKAEQMTPNLIGLMRGINVKALESKNGVTAGNREEHVVRGKEEKGKESSCGREEKVKRKAGGEAERTVRGEGRRF